MFTLFLIVVIAALWRIGGAGREEIKFARSWYRDTIIPVIFFLFFWVMDGFIIGLLTGLATLSIRMGYGAYSPETDSKPSWLARVTKFREGWKIRVIYGVITSFAIGLFPTAYAAYFGIGEFSLKPLLLFLNYIFVNALGEFLVNRTIVKNNVWIVEPITGACRALVLFL